MEHDLEGQLQACRARFDEAKPSSHPRIEPREDDGKPVRLQAKNALKQNKIFRKASKKIIVSNPESCNRREDRC